MKTLAILLGEHPCIVNILFGPMTVHYREVLLYLTYTNHRHRYPTTLSNFGCCVSSSRSHIQILERMSLTELQTSYDNHSCSEFTKNTLPEELGTSYNVFRIYSVGCAIVFVILPNKRKHQNENKRYPNAFFSVVISLFVYA